MQTRCCNMLFLIVFLSVVLVGCNDNEYIIPEGIKELTNDCLKRSLGPNMVGGTIEFAYAIALPYGTGRLVLTQVEATISGADGTYLEHHSYHTGSGGQDIGVEIGAPSITRGNLTEVIFERDTVAATLRYYYVIPEDARGKEVSFKFLTVDSNGKEVSYDMGPYKISEMDMKLDIVLANNSFFSISDMEVYDAEIAATIPEKIDLVYLFRTMRGVNFGHSFVSPVEENSEYLPNITLPLGLNNSTKLMKVYASADQHLARDEFGVFVDDVDLRTIDLSNSPNYGINLTKNAGAWLETSDGRYRAYMYINVAPDRKPGVTISIKRLKIK